MKKKRKEITVDELDEDPIISTQKFLVMSYLLPDPKSNKLQTPMVKIRGAYENVEACEKRAEYLQKIDPHFDIIHAEMGKWLGLFPREELMKNDDINVKYREHMLNTMMGDYKQNRREANINFENRKRAMLEKAKHEGTVEGQIELAGKREEPIALATRISNYKIHIQELQDKIKETEEMLEAAQRKRETEYQPEEFDFEKQLQQQQIEEGADGNEDRNEEEPAVPPSILDQINHRIQELEQVDLN